MIRVASVSYTHLTEVCARLIGYRDSISDEIVDPRRARSRHVGEPRYLYRGWSTRQYRGARSVRLANQDNQDTT